MRHFVLWFAAAVLLIGIGRGGQVLWHYSGWPVGDGFVVRKAVLQDRSAEPHVLIVKFGKHQIVSPVPQSYWETVEKGQLVNIRERKMLWGTERFVFPGVAR